MEPSNEFELFPYLATGGGPFVPGNLLATPPATPTIVGQLNPWPGDLVPGTIACSTMGASASSAAPSPPPPATPDTIQIISATTSNERGEFIAFIVCDLHLILIGTIMTTVIATTSSFTAQLFLTITGVDDVSPEAMDNIGSGLFSLTIGTKGKPTAVTVTSSANGTPITQSL